MSHICPFLNHKYILSLFFDGTLRHFMVRKSDLKVVDKASASNPSHCQLDIQAIGEKWNKNRKGYCTYKWAKYLYIKAQQVPDVL